MPKGDKLSSLRSSKKLSSRHVESPSRIINQAKDEIKGILNEMGISIPEPKKNRNGSKQVKRVQSNKKQG